MSPRILFPRQEATTIRQPHPTPVRRRRLVPALFAALLGVLIGLPTTGPAAAQQVKAVQLSDAERTSVSRIEQYLNSLRSVESRFLQVTSTGEYAEGKLYISRPGKLRIDYDPPVPVQIISSGTWLVYFDKELEQVSRVLMSSTPAAMLVSENIELFSKDILITGFEHEAQTFRLSLARADDPLEGRLTLVLSDRPIVLKKWEITDAQGVTTTVSLLDPRFDAELDDKLFEFKDPTIFKPRH